MHEYFSRAGPPAYDRPRPSAFRDSLADLREAVRGGLAEAASVAVARAVGRVAARLLGEGGSGAVPHHARRSDRADDGWGDYEDEDGGRDDDRHGRDRRGDGGGRRNTGGCTEGRPGAWRVVVAACCQALASLARAVAPAGAPRALSIAALSALTLLLGGGLFACEAGLALAEATWAIVDALAARNEFADH